MDPLLAGLGAGGQTCTLYRSQASKTAGGDPTTALGNAPLTEQVINRADGTCDLTIANPANSLVFRYVCDNNTPTCTRR